MTPEAASKRESFTRIAHFNYNTVSQRYEYSSLDTRAPQLMTYEAGVKNNGSHDGGVALPGGIFVAPRWGEARNVRFKYRLAISGIQNNRQSVRLYLTPQSSDNSEEFLAFEYVYTRRH